MCIRDSFFFIGQIRKRSHQPHQLFALRITQIDKLESHARLATLVIVIPWRIDPDHFTFEIHRWATGRAEAQVQARPRPVSYTHLEELLSRFPELSVYGHVDELMDGHRIPAQTHGLVDGESFSLFGTRVLAMHVPGHTLTAVAYHFPDEEMVFTGDTLFGAGCGRLFEGTSVQLHGSLGRLAALPSQTRVFSGHEYLAKNLLFARHIEPTNAAMLAREQDCSARRDRGEPCEPSTMACLLYTSETSCCL